MGAVNVSLDNSSLPAAVITLQKSLGGATQMFTLPAPPTKTTATTLTGAELLGGLIIANPASTVNYQLPIASALELSLIALNGAVANDDAFKFTIVNIATAANIVTLTTNAGWTLVGSMTVAGAATGIFTVRRTGQGQYTLYDA